METADQIKAPDRIGIMVAPILAILWLSALLASLALLLFCWHLVQESWRLL